MGFVEWTNWSNVTGKGFFHGKNTLSIGPRSAQIKLQFGSDFIDSRWKDKYENGFKFEDKDYWKIWKIDFWAIRISFWRNKGKT